jgi:ABC-type bacteriocin/lantibiotic exporter with double-glycine peptidase domain
MIYLLPLILVIVAVTKFLQGTIFFRLAAKASINFHRSLATTDIDASLEFFHIHYVGNILNRFSEDLLYIDEIVPYSIYIFLNISGSCLGVLHANPTDSYRHLKDWKSAETSGNFK